MPSPSVPMPHLPPRIEGLVGIATNLAWSWDREARALFRALDQPTWHLTRHNPVELLHRVDPARLQACAQDPDYLRRYDAVYEKVSRRLSSPDTWFAGHYPGAGARPIAYFCAEFGLHNSVPIYSGGLGILAGDHCKAASDLGVPLVGIGLFYTKGYFDQRVRLDGRQEDADERFDPGVTPLTPVLGKDGEPFLAVVRTFGRPVHVGAWRLMVGRVPVYLLDTSLELNHPEDRELTHKLYAGGAGLRLGQEWILGVGGVRVLRAVGIDPAAWHANEGHAAFMLLERVREMTCAGTPFADAVRQVRATSVFTTHTPVPAGHDIFSAEQVQQCAGPIWEELGTEPESFLRLGYHPTLDHGQYHMTAMAIRLSGRVNAVSRRHGEETRRIWRDLWPGRDPAQVPIGHVTNGAHVSTWMAHWIKQLVDEDLGPDWESRMDEPELWDRVLSLDDGRLWAIRQRMKTHLLDFIREEARRRWHERWQQEVSHLAGAGILLSSDVLTIGFARRFATYKRADLIFRDAERLRRLLVDVRRPVQLIFAGKAHPADEPGKDVLQRVYSFTRDPRFEGRVAFLEDYEMHLAHRLVQGVDLWLNLPRAPLEACGTSGMKAGLNGIPQLSTLDGWWAEGHSGVNGWAIPLARPDEDGDAADAEQLYTLLEREVVPLFYTRDERGIPLGWLRLMKHALHVTGARFTARRAVEQYVREYYAPAMRAEATADDPPTA